MSPLLQITVFHELTLGVAVIVRTPVLEVLHGPPRHCVQLMFTFCMLRVILNIPTFAAA